MNLNPFLGIVIETILFFELSDDGIVDSDTAVKQLESIAASLRSLADDEQQEFLRFAQKIATEEFQEFGNTDRVKILRSLGETLGLIV